MIINYYSDPYKLIDNWNEISVGGGGRTKIYHTWSYNIYLPKIYHTSVDDMN